MNTTNNNLSAISDVIEQNFSGSIAGGTATPIDIRKRHYLPFTKEDTHYLYDIVTTILDTLSANGIDVELKGSASLRIDHRKAVKARFPKN